MGATKLRPAQLADVDELSRWDGEPHVRAASGEDEPEDWPALLGGLPPDWEVLIIEANTDGRTRPIGVLQIIDPVTEPHRCWRPWFTSQGIAPAAQTLRAIDIWIGEADMLARGHGGAAMRLALERCFAVPNIEAVLIDPLARNEGARRFYARLGFRAVGRFRFSADECEVMRCDSAAFLASSRIVRM